MAGLRRFATLALEEAERGETLGATLRARQATPKKDARCEPKPVVSRGVIPALERSEGLP